MNQRDKTALAAKLGVKLWRRAYCPKCLRFVRLRDDGTTRAHMSSRRWDRWLCKGGENPVTRAGIGDIRRIRGSR